MLLDNRYELDPEKDRIGKGGFAEVYMALDTKFDMTVAIKHYTEAKSKAGSVTLEIRKCIQFNHINIIRYFDCFETSHINSLGVKVKEEYGVMEYANAGDLSTIISGKKTVSDEQFKEIILGILDGLHYLHQLPTPIIHRDLKPSNILLQEQNGKLTPKICDFGISREWIDATKTGTMTGMVGTREYMSPEQIKGKGIQPNTDLWALGCIIFEKYIGHPPFGKASNGTSIPVLNNNILNATLNTNQLGKIPEPFRALVKSCFVKDAGNRVANAKAAKAILLSEKNIQVPKVVEPIKPCLISPTCKDLRLVFPAFLLMTILILYFLKTNVLKNENIPNSLVVEDKTILAPIEEKQNDLPTSVNPPKVNLDDNTKKVPIQAEQQKTDEKRVELEQQKQSETERIRLLNENLKQKEVEEKRQLAEAEQKKKQQIVSINSLPLAIQKLIKDMVYVQGGTYTMGCTWEQSKDCYEDEKPNHSVTLKSYYIGKYEVTQAQWLEVMSNNPSDFSGCDNCPIESISWNDILIFIRKLNNLTGLNFRLLTEAEWEYAARGGNKSQSYKYSGSNNINNVAWYSENSGRKTNKVGMKSPNELGLYDMSGNVWECCSDLVGEYNGNNQVNPSGAITGNQRVLRGGSWFLNPLMCRVSTRHYWNPVYLLNYVGFRLACD